MLAGASKHIHTTVYACAAVQRWGQHVRASVHLLCAQYLRGSAVLFSYSLMTSLQRLLQRQSSCLREPAGVATPLLPRAAAHPSHQPVGAV